MGVVIKSHLMFIILGVSETLHFYCVITARRGGGVQINVHFMEK